MGGFVTTAKLNEVETRLARLELADAERQLKVLELVEKVQHQLTAREAKRKRDAAKDGGEVGELELEPGEPGTPRVTPTAHLARRFRLGG